MQCEAACRLASLQTFSQLLLLLLSTPNHFFHLSIYSAASALKRALLKSALPYAEKTLATKLVKLKH